MITSEIEGMSFTRSLLDTEASINILPKAVFDHHHVGELQPFLVELCLADGLVRKPHGLLEDVIVRIEDCYFPVDFLVVDMKMTKELTQAPIILGRPFLATAIAVTDWGERRSNSEGKRAHREGRHQQAYEIPFTSVLRLGHHRLRRRPDTDACVEEVMMIDEEARFEELPMDEPSLELKTLPSTLKYAFLDEEKTKPVIIIQARYEAGGTITGSTKAK